MKPILTLAITVSLSFLYGEETNWTSFRNGGTDRVDSLSLPLHWSETSGIAWRTSLEGYGQSSPVIESGEVIVTSTSGENKESLHVEAFDLQTGERNWHCEVDSSVPVPEVSDMISRGAPSPVVDSDGVYVFFESGDLLAFDRKGSVRWHRNLVAEYGEFVGGHGIGSSLVETPGGLTLLIDHDGPSYLLLIDKETGENVWKVDREPRVSWTTPLFLEMNGTPQVVISSNGEAVSYHLKDGKLLWRLDGLEKNTVASPSSNGDLIVIGSSEPGNSLAIKVGSDGEPEILWKAQSVVSSFGSPLIDGQTVYFVNRAGALQATNLSDGSLRWERRVSASTWATPLTTPERLYFFCKDGNTVIFPKNEIGKDTEPLAENRINVAEGDRLYGYAVSAEMIALRTGEALVVVK